MKTQKFPNPEFKIGDSVWLMIENKPKEYFVWTVKREEALTHESDYGYAYNHQVVVTYDYFLRSSKDNNYQSDWMWLSDAIKNEMKYYRTKQELINSL